jgi:ABC-type glycerol-3-phosphate transport system substrate-binding protein
MKIKFLLVLTLVFVVILSACAQPTQAPVEEPAAEEPAAEEPAAEEPAAEEPMEEAPAVSELNILWAQWDPADQLQQTIDQYEEVAGIKVNVIQEPWGSFGGWRQPVAGPGRYPGSLC